MSFMDIVSWLILIALLFWKFHWVVWGTVAFLLFACGRGFLKNAMSPFERDLETPGGRIASVFWGIMLIYTALRIILALFLGEHISFDLGP